MPTTDPDCMRLLARERLLLAMTELVSQILEERRSSRRQFAAALHFRPRQLSRRFSGKRDLTLRDVGDMFHVLGSRSSYPSLPTTATLSRGRTARPRLRRPRKRQDSVAYPGSRCLSVAYDGGRTPTSPRTRRLSSLLMRQFFSRSREKNAASR
jgi:hypothetical protein